MLKVFICELVLGGVLVGVWCLCGVVVVWVGIEARYWKLDFPFCGWGVSGVVRVWSVREGGLNMLDWL